MMRRLLRSAAAGPLGRGLVFVLRTILPPPRVTLTHYTCVLPCLPQHLDGLRVLHLSDLHLHPGSNLALQVPDLLATVDHDLLVYTGDYIDVTSDIPAFAALLRRMPQRAPAFAVLGNHDYLPFGNRPVGNRPGANDVHALNAAFSAADVVVLRNEARALYGGALYLVGVDDPVTHHDDVARAVAIVPPGAATLMLAHTPDVVLRLGSGCPGLILSGHTHGGQIRLGPFGPMITMSALPRHLAMGLGRYRGTQLFVSRGIGYAGLPLRLDCPSEVALLTLRAPQTPSTTNAQPPEA